MYYKCVKSFQAHNGRFYCCGCLVQECIYIGLKSYEKKNFEKASQEEILGMQEQWVKIITNGNGYNGQKELAEQEDGHDGAEIEEPDVIIIRSRKR